MSVRDYRFTDLDNKPTLVQEIVRLEERLHKETGEKVTLIAYSPSDGADPLGEEACRAGLND